MTQSLLLISAQSEESFERELRLRTTRAEFSAGCEFAVAYLEKRLVSHVGRVIVSAQSRDHRASSLRISSAPSHSLFAEVKGLVLQGAKNVPDTRARLRSILEFVRHVVRAGLHSSLKWVTSLGEAISNAVRLAIEFVLRKLTSVLKAIRSSISAILGSIFEIFKIVRSGSSVAEKMHRSVEAALKGAAEVAEEAAAQFVLARLPGGALLEMACRMVAAIAAALALCACVSVQIILDPFGAIAEKAIVRKRNERAAAYRHMHDAADRLLVRVQTRLEEAGS